MLPRLASAALAVLLLVARAHGAPVPPEASATVNGVAIPRSSLLDVVQALVAQLDDIPDTKTTEKYRRQALDSLIDFELLYQDGQARELVVTEADVEAEIKRTEKSFPSPKAYEEALQAKGLTRADIEAETRRALLVSRVLKDVVWPGVATPADQVSRYYEQHRSEFQHPAQIRASYILVRTGKAATAAEKKAARDKADELVRRARDGEDFARLAQEASEDPATAQKGGDLGFFGRGTMGEIFDEAAFVLNPGQISDPVGTSFGFMLIKVTGKRGAGVAPLEEVRPRIEAVIRGQGRDKAQERFLEGLRSKAKIEIAPDLR